MKSFNPKIYLFVLVTIIIGTEISAQNKNCDYISSRYYHKVAKAELFWLEKNYKECYRVLSDLDTLCQLLNGDRMELYRFADLCLMYKNYSKASESIRSLIINYGYKLEDFVYMRNFHKMKKIPKWKIFKNELLSLEKIFVLDTMLYNKITQIIEDDQYYRTNASIIRKIMRDSTANIDSLAKLYSLRTPLMSIEDIDNINYQKLIHIMDTKGSPLSFSIKYHRKERQDVSFALRVMLIHFSRDSVKFNYLKPILLQYINQGSCPPDLFAVMTDAYQVANKQLFLYGEYSTSSPKQIFEFEKLNDRRREIGLPDYELVRQIKAKEEALKNSKKK